jgi:beta-glucosidase
MPDAADFLWGTSTAAHQVEGGNRWNDWWALEESGRLPHRSGEACRHYELYESDFDLAQSLGHNAHRLSLEWSRIEPAEGEWNTAALDHYASVIAALRARSLEPLVTLQHFTLPAWLARRGGWLAPDALERFARYAEAAAGTLSRDVRFWITINEPTVYAKHAYVSCDWPPCGYPSWLNAARVVHRLGRAHVRAYDILHRHRQDAQVGIAHSTPYIVPCNPRRMADRLAASLRGSTLNSIPFRCFGRPACKALDFIGINYYARQVVRASASPFGSECTTDHHGAKRHFSALGWEVFPPGLAAVLRQFSRYGLPLIVTENGIATDDEEERTRYLRDHVASLSHALNEGIDVRGYFWWTLMDNYEWTSGREARFGLYETDYSTQERRPRPAAIAFRELIGS